MAGCCSIVPPYVLEAIAREADAQTGARARETLELTRMLMEQRATVGHDAPMIAATHEGDRRTVYDAGHMQRLPGAIVRRDGQALVADADVNAAYDNAGITYAFFSKVFGRNSIDGNGMRLLSTVHYSHFYDNAFWNGSQMVYGDGDGVVLGRFSNALEVIAHELSHGVTQMTCGLAYHGEPGALNESISDVFGSMVKQWHRKQTVDEAHWRIG